MKGLSARRIAAAASHSTPTLLAALALLLPLGPAQAAAPPARGAGPFGTGKVLSVHITLSAEEYAAIEPRGGFRNFGPKKEPEKKVDTKRESHRNDFGFDLPFGTGDVTVGGETFKKVSIRYKGNGTIFDTTRSIKKSFKIDLGSADGRFGGSKKINLHCGVTDPSKLREVLGYELYRAAGVTAPRTALAEVRLTVPGKYDKELLGLYVAVEEVDKPFLKDRFGSDKGLLMKPKDLRDFRHLGDDWDLYKKSYLPRREATAEEAKRLVAFAKLVDKADDEKFAKEVGSYLDVDGYLRFLAATAFLANTDNFWTVGHNYYLYLHPKTNKIHFVPWDLDRAFANWMDAKQSMDLSLTHPYGGTHKLTERLLAAPGTSAKYQKLLKDLAAGPFAKDRLTERLAAHEKVVKDPRERDARAAAARKERGGFGPFGGKGGGPPDLADFIKARTESVAAQLEGKSKGYVPKGFGGFGFGAPPAEKKKEK
jgi:spore coat protein CotH